VTGAFFWKKKRIQVDGIAGQARNDGVTVVIADLIGNPFHHCPSECMRSRPAGRLYGLILPYLYEDPSAQAAPSTSR
jgi:hypothetical protein